MLSTCAKVSGWGTNDTSVQFTDGASHCSVWNGVRWQWKSSTTNGRHRWHCNILNVRHSWNKEHKIKWVDTSIKLFSKTMLILRVINPSKNTNLEPHDQTEIKSCGKMSTATCSGAGENPCRKIDLHRRCSNFSMHLRRLVHRWCENWHWLEQPLIIDWCRCPIATKWNLTRHGPKARRMNFHHGWKIERGAS